MKMKLNEERIAAYLTEHIGESLTAYLLIRKSGAYDGDLEKLEVHDYFELNEEVQAIAKANGFRLDMRHHQNHEEGLPWNLDFIIKKRKSHLIYRYRSKGSYRPYSYEIRVYDREKNNVRIREENLFEPENAQDDWYSISQKTLNKIKKIINDSGIMNISKLEEPELLVEDGAEQSIYFSIDGDVRRFRVDNLFLTYKGISVNSQVGKLIITVEKINKIIERETE